MNQGRVTALRHSFCVQATVSHERASQCLWKCLWSCSLSSLRSASTPPWPTAAITAPAALVNVCRLESPPQGGSQLWNPIPSILKGDQYSTQSMKLCQFPCLPCSFSLIDENTMITSCRMTWNSRLIHLSASSARRNVFLGSVMWAFLKSRCVRACVLSHFSHVQLFCNPMDYSPPGSSVHGISLDSRMIPSRWPFQSLGRCCKSCNYEGGSGLPGSGAQKFMWGDPSRSELKMHMQLSIIFKPGGRWGCCFRTVPSWRKECDQCESGKNTGVGCHVLLQESSQPRDRTRISCVSCIQFFTSSATWEAPKSQ